MLVSESIPKTLIYHSVVKAMLKDLKDTEYGVLSRLPAYLGPSPIGRRLLPLRMADGLGTVD